MGETLHVYYKNYKRNRFFSINTKYISSHELKTSEFSTLREIYLVLTSKKVNILYQFDNWLCRVNYIFGLEKKEACAPLTGNEIDINLILTV